MIDLKEYGDFLKTSGNYPYIKYVPKEWELVEIKPAICRENTTISRIYSHNRRFFQILQLSDNLVVFWREIFLTIAKKYGKSVILTMQQSPTGPKGEIFLEQESIQKLLKFVGINSYIFHSGLGTEIGREVALVTNSDILKFKLLFD